MSHPYLLPELFDHVVDFLHDSSGTLENCCLVSKSWIPRTRKYLFAEINFRYTEDLESWEANASLPLTTNKSIGLQVGLCQRRSKYLFRVL